MTTTTTAELKVSVNPMLSPYVNGFRYQCGERVCDIVRTSKRKWHVYENGFIYNLGAAQLKIDFTREAADIAARKIVTAIHPR